MRDDYLTQLKAIGRRMDNGTGESTNHQYNTVATVSDFTAMSQRSLANQRQSASSPDFSSTVGKTTEAVRRSNTFSDDSEYDRNTSERNQTAPGKVERIGQKAAILGGVTKRKLTDICHKLTSRQYIKTRLNRFRQSYYKEFDETRDALYDEPNLLFDLNSEETPYANEPLHNSVTHNKSDDAKFGFSPAVSSGQS